MVKIDCKNKIHYSRFRFISFFLFFFLSLDFYRQIRLFFVLVRSHEERRWLFEEPTQSRISPSILYHTKNKSKSETPHPQQVLGPDGNETRKFRGARTAPGLISYARRLAGPPHHHSAANFV